ncbi:MAG: hypothetical protein ACOX8L_02390 [Candidatus Methanomethylophilaceae archaeon]|jgi:hypothetical protein
MTLDKKVGDQMKSTTSMIERIGLYIPIYRGYKQKNLRRDEDRAVRQEVARTLEGTKSDLGTVQRAVTGDLELLRDTERIRAKVDQYYISVKKAAGGYSGLSSSVKILEEELDRLIMWDARLVESAAGLRKESAELVAKIDRGEYAIRGDLRKLETAVDSMIDEYRNRDSVMKGFADGEE